MSLHGYVWMMADCMCSLNGGNELPSYVFTAVAKSWVRGYVTADTEAAAIEKIMSEEYEDIVDNDITDVVSVSDIWEC